MSAERYRKQLEKLCTDTAVVKRHDKVKGKDGISRPRDFEEEPFPCRWSAVQLGALQSETGRQGVAYSSKLFCAPEVIIMPGDTVIVTRLDVEREYEAGEAFLYETHQEVPLRRRDSA